MSNEIQQWKPESVADVVSEKIKAQFVQLIPDDVWKQMVQKQIDWFMQPLEVRSYGTETIAPLHSLIRTQLSTLFMEKIKKELSKPEWFSRWVDASRPNAASEPVKAIVAALLPDILALHYGDMVQQAVHMIRQNLPR